MGPYEHRHVLSFTQLKICFPTKLSFFPHFYQAPLESFRCRERMPNGSAFFHDNDCTNHPENCFFTRVRQKVAARRLRSGQEASWRPGGSVAARRLRKLMARSSGPVWGGSPREADNLSGLRERHILPSVGPPIIINIIIHGTC